ncbi:MAG: 50S ribosomal protein L2, partial [Muribaculaceae bacterium]|nr:50S ribosomal protein L2 [Muribaculaceae bacterium]
MAVKKFKPTTPGQRHKVIGVFKRTEAVKVDGKIEERASTANAPEKSLICGKKSTGGRNAEGHLTTRYMGGGHKRKYRFIDFKRNKDGVPAVVKAIEYDPNRSARIALLYYVDGAKAYIIAPNGLTVGSTVVSGENVAPEVGNALPLSNIPVGTLVHNIELRPGQGAFMARSAGT